MALAHKHALFLSLSSSRLSLVYKVTTFLVCKVYEPVDGMQNGKHLNACRDLTETNPANLFCDSVLAISLQVGISEITWQKLNILR